MVETTQPEDIKNIKVLLEMAIHKLCIAQERVTEIHQIIHQEVDPRIIQALSSLNEIMAMQAIEWMRKLIRHFCRPIKGQQHSRKLWSTFDTA